MELLNPIRRKHPSLLADMAKIYTKTGDDGTTGLFGNQRVRKDAPRIEAYGQVDELNACLGVVIAHIPSVAMNAKGWLDAIQSDLLVIGSTLATPASIAFGFLAPSSASSSASAGASPRGHGAKNSCVPLSCFTRIRGAEADIRRASAPRARRWRRGAPAAAR